MFDSTGSFERLENLVEKKNMSFYALGKELGMPSSFFSEWKKGKMMPKVDKLKKLATYFKVPIDYFLVEKPDDGA